MSFAELSATCFVPAHPLRRLTQIPETEFLDEKGIFGDHSSSISNPSMATDEKPSIACKETSKKRIQKLDQKLKTTLNKISKDLTSSHRLFAQSMKLKKRPIPKTIDLFD